MKKLRGLSNLPENACYSEMHSPVGVLTIVASTEGLHAVLWDTDQETTEYQLMVGKLCRTEDHPVIRKTKKQLTEYFQGQRENFELPLVLNGTDFQMSAWQQLMKISYAKTITYGEQAKRVGDKNKARAVGLANGLNPISIIIPCHRVIGSNGKLTGFAGGIDKKAVLLQLEHSSI